MDSKFGDSSCLGQEFSQQDNSIEFSILRSSSLLDFLNYSDCVTRGGGEPAISSFTEASASVSSEHIFHQSNLRKQWIASVSILSFSLVVIAITFVMVFLTHGEVITFLHLNVLNVRYHPAMENETSKQFKEISVPFCQEINRYIKSSYLSEIQQGCTLKNITKSHSYIGLHVLLTFKNSNKLSSSDQVRDIIISKSNLQPISESIYIKIHRFLIPYKSLRVNLIKAVSSSAAFSIKDFAVSKHIDLNTTWNYHLHFSTIQNFIEQTNSVTLAETETITTVKRAKDIIPSSVKRPENIANLSVNEEEIPIIDSATKQPSTKTAFMNGKLFINKTFVQPSGNKTQLFMKKLFNNTFLSTSWSNKPLYSFNATNTPGWTNDFGVWGYRFIATTTSKSFDLHNSNKLSDVLNSPNNKTLIEKSSKVFTNQTINISENIIDLDVDKGYNNQSEFMQGKLSITTSIPHKENNNNSQTKQQKSSRGSINIKTGINIKPSGSGWLAIPFRYLTRGSSKNKFNSSNNYHMNDKRKRQKASKELPVKVGVISSSKTVTTQNYVLNTSYLTSMNKGKPLHGSNNVMTITNRPFDLSEKDNIFKSSTTVVKTKLSFKYDTTYNNSYRDYVEREQQNFKLDFKNITFITHNQTTVSNVLSNVNDGKENSTLKLPANTFDKTTVRILHPGSEFSNKVIVTDSYSLPSFSNITRSQLESDQTHKLNESNQYKPNAITSNSLSTTISYKDVKLLHNNSPTYLISVLSSASNNRSKVSSTPNSTHKGNIHFKPTYAPPFLEEVSTTLLMNKYLKKKVHKDVTSVKSPTNRNQQFNILQTSTTNKLQGVYKSELNRNRNQVIISSQKPTTNLSQQDVSTLESNRDRVQQNVAITQSTRKWDQLSVSTSHKLIIDKNQRGVVAPQKSITGKRQQHLTRQKHTVGVTTPYDTMYNTVKPPPAQYTQNIVSLKTYLIDSSTDVTVFFQGLNLMKNATKVDHKNLSGKVDPQLDSNIKKYHPTVSKEIGVTAFMSAGFGWVKIPINKTLPESNIEDDTHNMIIKKNYKNASKLTTKSMKGSLLASIIINITNKSTTKQSVDVTDTKLPNSSYPTQNSIVTWLNVPQTKSNNAPLSVIESQGSNVLTSLAPENILTHKAVKKSAIYMLNNNISTVNPNSINMNTNYSLTTDTPNVLTASTSQELHFTPNILQKKSQPYGSTERSSKFISTQIKQTFVHSQNTPAFEQNKSLTPALNVTFALHNRNTKWSQSLNKIHPQDFSTPQFPSNTIQDMTTTPNQFISSPNFLSNKLQLTNSSSRHETVVDMALASQKPHVLPFKINFTTLNPPHTGSLQSLEQTIMKSKVTLAHISDSMSAVKITTPTTTLQPSQTYLQKEPQASN